MPTTIYSLRSRWTEQWIFSNTPIFVINIETERKECFNKINKIIKNMARRESNLEFSVVANSKLPSTHASTEKMRKSKGI